MHAHAACHLNQHSFRVTVHSFINFQNGKFHLQKEITYSHSKFYVAGARQSTAANKTSENKGSAQQVSATDLAHKGDDQQNEQGLQHRRARRGESRAGRQDNSGAARADTEADADAQRIQQGEAGNAGGDPEAEEVEASGVNCGEDGAERRIVVTQITAAESDGRKRAAEKQTGTGAEERD